MYKLSPSDFAYLYEECKHCYYLKIKYGITQPSMPMPGVFSALNTRIQGSLVGKNFNVLSPSLPDCQVIFQEGFVESIPIPDTSCFIKGKYDLLCQNSDSTYTLVDLKISQADVGKIEKYKTQLTAYKYAMENPKSSNPIKITKMGLLIFYPNTVSFENESAKVDFPPKWLEIPADEAAFVNFIKEVDKLLAGPLPADNPECKWCKYLKENKESMGDQEKFPF
ncbi:MAG: hypothetical protein US68_C0007G0023 [Candidatus Shapirobacteria bacterium GW2011_GWE1_38_10]|uniref:PD-(D/E)XK endonuclease-like domain-containing protein n=1 Tax=Candidatus Shapirobacteria bacterium GW2011_GWE1_38_10 TaxID=1618488 RepID=A0A0G0IGY9_9BACT|nr:MAG: hypothetical protein US46_C0007G0015 [Candidatus Shapirobacteria bacterium GW2011_GWF2_37_20]KKQ50260.1 MAG: hypothetical protein US68_C0007G0023 [Candidatus Shapirobacteria bacterium GW2011_GWE1_38_10]KKQ64794.1 MAG: hypothetical protein US85_C0003G0016 [Candidatus Shapirobacteria bacterium GW2011_GWF1_38_23]HBP50805.1 hypothetical protein [Candidatus Shapirobacteria bacterium]